ncbi:sensor domain-containing diguanylate cyclase [Granulosicoccus sp. 3-233]|uniref:sensor domain-containing diguanylate cyclase n=1 Tax=Granulosicoccus sp. 3-233 TaxID=3417969 RepID=UPI003D33F8C7
MNPNSLRLVLVSLVVLLQLTSLTVVSFLTKEQLANQSQLEATATLKAQADEVVEKTRLFLVPALSQLTTAGQLFADGMLDARRDQQLSTFFRSQLRSNLWLKGMFLAREDGSMVRVGRFVDDRRIDPGKVRDLLVTKRIQLSGDNRQVEYEEHNERTGETRHWSNPADNSDPRQLNWYQSARAQQRLVWSDAFSYHENGQPIVSASLPIRTPEGLDAGVLSVAVDLHELTRFIERTSGSNINSAVMIDANGRVIAYSSAIQHVRHRALSDIESMFRPSDEAMLELYARTNTTGISATGEDTLIEHLDMGEVTQMGLARRVNLFGGAIRWTLLITQPHWTKLHTSDNILNSVMRLATIIIAAPGIMALLLILAITAPVYRLHRRATIDQLTRAYNRDEFENRLRHRIHDMHNLPADKQLVSVVLDLDGFKAINDRHGHPTGDLILRAVVKRLQKHAPSDTLIGRLGGDEFALLCSVDKQLDPLTLMEQLRRQVTEVPVPSGNGVHTFGMTMGLSVICKGDSAETVLKRADLALVNGKLIEKNRTYDSTTGTGQVSGQMTPFSKPDRCAAACS